MKENLWHQFNLGENNLDVGGDLLYCTRYSQEKMEAMRTVIIERLENLGVDIFETSEESLAIDRLLASPQVSNTQIFHLIEELSVLNEALEMSLNLDGQLPIDLANYLNNLIALILDKKSLTTNKVDTYNLVTMEATEIIRALRIAEAQGHKLSAEEKTALDQFTNVSAMIAKTLDRGGVIMC